MNKKKLQKHLESFLRKSKSEVSQFEDDYKERSEITRLYGSYGREEILSLDEEALYKYLSPLWAMRIWGNKHYVVDKIVEDNGLETLLHKLAELLYGTDSITSRWDSFRSDIKGIGPAMMSELLCRTHPNDFMIWNRRAHVGLRYLEVKGLPRYDYQLTGEVYEHLCDVCREIAAEMERVGFEDHSLLAVDYFIWDELQVEDSLTTAFARETEEKIEPKPGKEVEFIHNDVRDKLRDIGQWLGFESSIEKKVAEGSQVDTVWESTIGNMGRVIYVFEVQTKGSIDSLIVNLLKALNNSAVQGIVAVSDKDQLTRIERHASGVRELRDQLRYWDYEEVLRVHESLEYVNSSINDLGLVPQGF